MFECIKANEACGCCERCSSRNHFQEMALYLFLIIHSTFSLVIVVITHMNRLFCHRLSATRQQNHNEQPFRLSFRFFLVACMRSPFNDLLTCHDKLCFVCDFFSRSYFCHPFAPHRCQFGSSFMGFNICYEFVLLIFNIFSKLSFLFGAFVALFHRRFERWWVFSIAQWNASISITLAGWIRVQMKPVIQIRFEQGSATNRGKKANEIWKAAYLMFTTFLCQFQPFMKLDIRFFALSLFLSFAFIFPVSS